MAGLVKENRELKDEILRARSYSRGIEASGEGEAEPVSDTKGQKSTRPTSMYETREALRYWSGKSDESRNGTQSLYQRQLYTQGTPRYEDVIRRTEQVAKRIKELWTAVQAGDFTTFVPCAERIRVAVAELTAIFPQVFRASTCTKYISTDFNVIFLTPYRAHQTNLFENWERTRPVYKSNVERCQIAKVQSLLIACSRSETVRTN